MAKTSFSTKSYEVQVREDDRWIVDAVYAKRAEAEMRAAELVDAARHEAVRIVADDDAKATQAVVFEQEIKERKGKSLTIGAIQEAPVCVETADYYAYPARRTLGRLLRQYLDDEGLTALELLFDAQRLSAIARMDALFGSAIRRIAALQVEADGLGDRLDELQKAFARIRRRAQASDATAAARKRLADEGLPALIAWTEANAPADDRMIAVLEALAGALASTPGWRAKVTALLDIADKGLDAEAARLVDEIVAEIVDGARAAADLLGHRDDRAEALLALATLAKGQRSSRLAEGGLLHRLSGFSTEGTLPLTAGVLLGRVARGLKDVAPLTKGDSDAERQALTTLIKTLAAPTGLVGGAVVAEAVAQRVQTTFGLDRDLELAEAIERIRVVLPSRASSLGFLVSLVQSPLGRASSKPVLAALRSALQELDTLASLMPAGTPPEALSDVLDALLAHVRAADIPDPVRTSIETSLTGIAAHGPARERAAARAEAPRDPAHAPAGPDSLARLRVLVVEDERFTRQLVLRLLRDLGCREIQDAVDGADGLARLQQMHPPPDLVLLDLAMPGMNGFEFIQRVREMSAPERRDVPIVVLTGHGTEAAVRRAAELGISGYVVKPVARATLEKQILRALG